MNFVIKKHLFCSFDSTLKLPPIFDPLEWSVNSKFHLTLFIPPNFKLFGNLDDFQMFVSYWFQSICIFLNKFKRIDIRDNWNVNISDGMNKIRNKFFLFLAVLNNSTLFILNEFFYYDNINGKRSMIRWISNMRVNAVIINFHRIRRERKNRSITKFILLILSKY